LTIRRFLSVVNFRSDAGTLGQFKRIALALWHLPVQGGLCASVVVLADGIVVRRRVICVSGIFFRYACIER